MERFLEIRQKSIELFEKINNEISINKQFINEIDKLENSFNSFFGLVDKLNFILNSYNSLPINEIDDYLYQLQCMVDVYAKY